MTKVINSQFSSSLLEPKIGIRTQTPETARTKLCQLRTNKFPIILPDYLGEYVRLEFAD